MKETSQLKEILKAGYKHLDKAQYDDAMEYFLSALQLYPEDEQAKLAYNEVIRLIVPRYHFNMLNDYHRNTAYDTAIRNAVDSSKTVLDVGTGSGLLSMMAARAGAQKTYACEMIQPIADLAKVIIASNSLTEKIKVINKKSQDLILGVDIPDRANLLITETIDSGLIGEGIIPIIVDAKKRLLSKDANIIPRGATVYGALIETQEIFNLNHVSSACGFDVSQFNNLSTDGCYPVRLERFNHKFLSEPFEICGFNFLTDTLNQLRSFSIPITPKEDGLCHAITYWFELFLDENIVFTNSPDNLESHWKQAVQCLPMPMSIKSNQKILLSVRQGLTKFDFELIQPV